MIKLLSNGTRIETTSIDSINFGLRLIKLCYETPISEAVKENKHHLVKRYENKLEDLGKELERIVENNPETWIF